MDLTKRNFMKLCISVPAGISLIPFIEGCAEISKIQEDVDKIQWDVNPRIPIPKNGCYVGWHSSMIQDYWPDRTELLNKYKSIDAPYLEKHLNYHELIGNCLPAVYSFSNIHIGADWFPLEICNTLHRMGVIPLIRFFPTYELGELVKGTFDVELKDFASSIVQFGKPLFFVPWPMINRITNYKGHVYGQAGPNPEVIKEAWEYMHEIFKNSGANEYAIWGFQILPADSRESIEKYKIPPELFDWLGFTLYTFKVKWPQKNFYYDLMDAYEWAQVNYPRKPIALFEMGSSYKGQEQWITRAYKTIKQLPRIKMAMYTEKENAAYGLLEHLTFIREEAKAAYKEALSDPYFIKGGQQLKEILNFKQ